jgi:integrase
MGWAARIPTTKGVKLVKRYGYPNRTKADADAAHAGRLLDLAGADETTRAKIGDLIVAAKRGAPLPALEDVRRRLGLGMDPGAPGETVADWMSSWLAGKARIKRASTVRSYEQHNRLYITPVIGDLPLERVNPGHVENVLAAVPGSAGTRHRVLATLRAALNAAVRARKIIWNPCLGIEPLEPENPPEQQRWTPEQAHQFIKATAGDPMGLMFRVMVLKGVRRGELCGLRWCDVSPDCRMLSIRQTILQLGGKITMGTPKTKAGVRRVYLGPKTAALLKAHRDAQPARIGPGGRDDTGLVFCRPGGAPWNPDHVSKRFKVLAKAAGVPVVKLHEGGRHTAISLMDDAGMAPEMKMRESGHSDAKTSSRYTHPLDEAYLAAAEDVENLVEGAS